MLDFLLHLEQSLPLLLEQYGVWIYAILFLVIFAETGSPFFFLPGDSLLIAVGALCSIRSDYLTLHGFIAADCFDFGLYRELLFRQGARIKIFQ